MRQLRLLTWGLVPCWAKDPKVRPRMINARVESVLDKPGFARAAAARRCLVPADGWYEWQASPTAVDAKGKPRKQPFFTHRADGAAWPSPACTSSGATARSPTRTTPDAWLTTFTIVTGRPSRAWTASTTGSPACSSRERWATGSTPPHRPADVLRAARAATAGRFVAYPVSSGGGRDRQQRAAAARPGAPPRSSWGSSTR